MLELLKEQAYSIAVVVMLGSIAEAAAPAESYRKYIHIILGTILILTLIRPLGSLLGTISAETIADAYQGAASAAISTEQIEEKQQNDLMTLYKERLEETIRAEVEAECGVQPEDVSVTLDAGGGYAPKSVEITADGAAAEIRSCVSELIGIRPAEIKIIAAENAEETEASGYEYGYGN